MALLNRGQQQYSEEKYVTRTMKCLPDKFIELCHMHLAFLLDLSGDRLELLLSSHDEHKKKKSGLASVGMFKKKEKPHAGLFGLPLTDEGVCLMIPLIKFLKLDKNISKEGLFRKPGNKTRMTTLRELLVVHGPAVSIDPEIFSPYDVACVLKEFLRELPEPLLTERHMEAHRQILALGQHARAPEEIARYACRKLSALQLLMLLLPSPAQKLIMNLTQLLQRIADCPESKMTSATLGTIFAPIFFIDRKAEPSELCSQISQTAPAVSFMIEKAHELFQAPRELVIDLANYWTALGQAPFHSENVTEPNHMKKSLSGRTLSTNVCYLDRELSRCDDVISNTQAEITSLIAHVQSLPDTPHNVKLKKQILKTATTPVLSCKKRRRSKSIGASIRKRLPSLGRLTNKQGDLSGRGTSSSSITDTKTVAPALSDLLRCPAHSIATKDSQQPSRPGHKRLYTAEISGIVASPICTPPKQKYMEVKSCRNVLSDCENQNIPSKIRSEEHLTENRDPNNRQCWQVESCTHITSDVQNQNFPPSNSHLTESRGPTCLTPFPKLLDPAQTFSPTLLSGCEISSPLLARNKFIQSETESDFLSHHAVKEITAPGTHCRDRKPVPRIQPQPCRKPGTPIMPRAVLRLVPNNTLESSF